MKTVEFRGRADKLTALMRIFSPYLGSWTLDVGCDARHVRHHVPGRYVGIDRQGCPDVLLNLEFGLPFRGLSFDTVIATDCLEHLDAIHDVFDDLCRVSRRFVIIGLPNMYEWGFRLNYVLGRRLSGKYGLPTEQPVDRHKWLFSLEEARSFVAVNARRNGFQIVDEVFGYYRYNRTVPRAITRLSLAIAPRARSLFAYHFSAVLERAVTATWDGTVP